MGIRLKRYSDGKRPKGVCYDCKRAYNTFPDLVVPDDVWEKINPTNHQGAGILCPTCIAQRLQLLSIGPVNCVIYS